jgi:hypothetical protein
MSGETWWTKLNAKVRILSKNVAVFAVAGTIIAYWNTFEDKIADRHERAWSVIRTAMQWSKDGWGGNVGQNNAIEILTRDCHSWSTAPPLSYVLSYFFQDCVPLQSLTLKAMDFRSLQSSGNLSDSFFACSNFGNADLRYATLRNVRFHAADLKDADLSNADLSNACFYKANLAGVKLNGVKNLDTKTLLNACILKLPGESKRAEIVSDIPEIQGISTKIPDCVDYIRCGNWDASKWDCGE